MSPLDWAAGIILLTAGLLGVALIVLALGLARAADRTPPAPTSGHRCQVCATATVHACGDLCDGCNQQIWASIRKHTHPGSDLYDHVAVEDLHADLERWDKGGPS